MIDFTYNGNGVNVSKTYDGVSSVFASASLGVCLGSSEPSIGASSIN